jgi:predicted GH43/DUF377 family glycosyl hydrolase
MQAISRLFNRCLLRPPDLPPSRDGWEVIGVFNPGAIETGEGVVLLVRVAERPAERRPGLVALPRWDMGTGQPVVDWVREDESLPVDVRVVRLKGSGLVRLNFISHLRVIRTRDGRTIDSIDDGTRFEPMTEYEEFGVEDPRITRIGDTFFFTYVAVSRHGVATALASTRDFESFERHGIMLPPENKDVALFPEKIGAGTPPVRTPEGWLEIYHGNCRREGDPDIGVYAAGVLLLDIDDPRRILRASGAVIVPTTAFEKNGYVPNVVFPTGIVERGETALVYYGAADTCTGVVEFSLREMLNAARKI